MLYKHSFSILCWHLNLNQKRKKIEFGRLPVKPTGIPVKPAGSQMRRTIWICTGIWPVSGETGPVYRNRSAPVWGVRLGKKNPGHGTAGLVTAPASTEPCWAARLTIYRWSERPRPLGVITGRVECWDYGSWRYIIASNKRRHCTWGS